MVWIWQVFIGIYYAVAVFACIYTSGHKSSGGDERQKEIRKRATQASWIGMILYSIEKGIRGIPVVENFYRETVNMGPFVPENVMNILRHGLDVVLVGVVFYIIFYLRARRLLS
jgi:hypothetical protein